MKTTSAVVTAAILLTLLPGCGRSGPKAPPEWTPRDRRNILDEQERRAKLIEKGEKLAYEGEKKRKEGDRVREEPVSLKAGDRKCLLLPYSEQDGIPVLAILEESGFLSRIDWDEEMRSGKASLNQLSPMPTLVIWSNGRIMWRHNLFFHFQSRISPSRVQEVLSSIEIGDYNRKRYMDRSYAARCLQGTGPEYMILFASKGKEQNIILCSPFHFWREAIGNYVYWDEESLWEDSYDSNEHSWRAFAKDQPKDFFAYLGHWQSLEAKLLPLLPEKAEPSALMDMEGKITLIRCLFEYRDGTPPQWVRVVPEELPVVEATPEKSSNKNDRQ